MSTNNFANERNIIGMGIKAYRKANGLTLQDMADTINASTGFLSEVERGIKIPGSAIILSIKKNYPDLNLNELFQANNVIDIDLEKLIIKDPIESQNTKEDYEDFIDRHLEDYATSLVERIENAPFSQKAKLLIIDSLIRIVELDLAATRREQKKGSGGESG